MSFDNQYPNRKDRRKPYRGAKAHDATCRNHGSCSYCESNRTFNDKKNRLKADEDYKDYIRCQLDDNYAYTIPERDMWPDMNFEDYNPWNMIEGE